MFLSIYRVNNGLDPSMPVVSRCCVLREFTKFRGVSCSTQKNRAAQRREVKEGKLKSHTYRQMVMPYYIRENNDD